MDIELVAHVAAAILAANDHAPCRHRDNGNPRVFGREVYRHRTGDQILEDHGISYSRDPIEWAAYVRAAVHAANLTGQGKRAPNGRRG